MTETKLTKSIGEYLVAGELARHGWASALTRDGLARTDILAVDTLSPERRQIEIQVKTTVADPAKTVTWQLGKKDLLPSAHEREFYVLTLSPKELTAAAVHYVLPRVHLAAAMFISHQDWLTEPGIQPGQRNAGLNRARLHREVIARYRDRWDLLRMDQSEAPVLLPPKMRDLALDPRVGLPPRTRVAGEPPGLVNPGARTRLRRLTPPPGVLVLIFWFSLASAPFRPRCRSAMAP